MSEIYVKGLSDLQAYLDTVPLKIEKNIMRGALREGMKPVFAAAYAECPTGAPSEENARLYHDYDGALRDSLRLGTTVKGASVIATVKAGGKNSKTGADVWYAHLIEFTGAAPHLITARIGGNLAFGGGFYHTVMHPGMKAHAFMRPALDGNAQLAVISAAQYMQTRLATKQGLDTAWITIEGDE